MYLVARRGEMLRNLLIDLMHVFFFVSLVGILLLVRRHVGGSRCRQDVFSVLGVAARGMGNG